MKVRWEDLNARTGGLRTRLVTRDAFMELAGAPDLNAMAELLAGLGWPRGGVTGPELELQVRREAARRMRILARWLGPRAAVLSVAYEAEDRRSVRALLRGAAGERSARERLAGLLPTPALPERALEALAGAATPQEVAALLTVWAHPFGPALLPTTAVRDPDLARIEMALQSVFATRAVRSARRGGPALKAYVAESIDLLNLGAVGLLAEGKHELDPAGVILPGGTLDPKCLLRALAAGPGGARHELSAAVRDKEGGPVRLAARKPEASELEVLEWRIAHWQRRARVDPVGAAPLLEYLLRLRAEALRLQWLIWVTDLSMPPGQRRAWLAAA